MEAQPQALRALHARSLLEQGLLESAETLAMLALQSMQASAQDLALIGEVCLAKGEHRRALHFLHQAQQLSQLRWGDGSGGDDGGGGGGSGSGATASRGAPPAAEGKGSAAAAAAAAAGWLPPSAPAPLPLAVTLRMQVAECHERQGEEREAVAALEGIPRRHRTPRVWARLGHIYRRCCMRTSAIQAYKACLGLCPYAAEAALALAELRVPAGDIEALVQGMAHPALLAQLLEQQPWQQQQQQAWQPAAAETAAFTAAAAQTEQQQVHAAVEAAAAAAAAALRDGQEGAVAADMMAVDAPTAALAPPQQQQQLSPSEAPATAAAAAAAAVAK